MIKGIESDRNTFSYTYRIIKLVFFTEKLLLVNLLACAIPLSVRSHQILLIFHKKILGPNVSISLKP
jgi:hypothetical protein